MPIMIARPFNLIGPNGRESELPLYPDHIDLGNKDVAWFKDTRFNDNLSHTHTTYAIDTVERRFRIGGNERTPVSYEVLRRAKK